MKRLICILLTLVVCLGLLTGCYKTTNENGVEVEGIDNFVIIQKITEYDWIVYDKTTMVVYYIEVGTHGGYLCPYQIYSDGGIYGAIYENGVIKPIPYSIHISEDTIHNFINSAFGSH